MVVDEIHPGKGGPKWIEVEMIIFSGYIWEKFSWRLEIAAMIITTMETVFKLKPQTSRWWESDTNMRLVGKQANRETVKMLVKETDTI